MRKEVFFAIIAGVTIGLVVAFGAWKATLVVKNISTSKPSLQKSPPPKTNTNLSLDNISDYDVITESPFKLNGVSTPLTDIVISTSEDDYYTKTDQEGAFSVDIELPAGLSELIVDSKKFTIVYSSEFKKYLTSIDNEELNSSDEAKTIRDQIAEKLASKNGKGTSYIGTITDISSGTIQTKGKNGEILQISLSDDTTYINTLKKNAEVKITDLAIGDYIVAMGFPASNRVLDTKRILVTSPLVELKIEVNKVKIDKITKTNINDIVLPKKWVGPGVKELEVGQSIIVVGTKEDDKFDLRTIFIPIL